jgi:ferredoxin-NADP reductase
MAATNLEIWQRAEVISRREEAKGIVGLTLRQSDPAKAHPGSHIDLMVDVDGSKVRRSYSVVSQSEDLRDISIAVFQVPLSRGGSIAMHQLQVGDSLDITQPLQNFPLRIGASKYLLLAGGIGVTAIAGMARTLKSVGADYRLLYSARSPQAMAFRDELSEEHGDRIELFFDSEGNRLSVPEVLDGLDDGTELYMCGPIRLMDEVRREWIARSKDFSNLRFETFGASGWFDPEEFIVRIPAKNLEVVVEKHRSMLEAIELAGVEMMADCRKGECGLCEVRVINLEGKIDHRDVFYSDRQKNEREKVACCVSRVVADESAMAISEDGKSRAVIEIIIT